MKINIPLRPNTSGPVDPTFLARHTETVVSALKANIGFTDNMDGKVITMNLAHGVPQLQAIPLRGGAVPIGAIAINCDTQPIPSLTVNTSATVQGKLTQAQPGFVYVTALYPLAEQYVQLIQTSNAQVFTTAVETVVTWASINQQVGNNITYNAAAQSLVAGVKGRYLVTANYFLGFAAAGARFSSLWLNGASRAAGISPAVGDTNTGVLINLVLDTQFAAGDSVQLKTYQDSGANLSANCSATNLGLLSMTQLSNDASLTANVTLFLVGS